jgi:hypothetical protein
VAQRPTILRTPENVSEALARAERELRQPPSGNLETVQVAPAEIKTRPELFQPRGFSSIGALDADHVAKLARRIARKGELDPPLIVKLGEEWICVDGHHRIAAYLGQSKNGAWRGPISCLWFAGGVREAVDEGVKRNEVIKLEMRRGDRYEAAWQRVVLGWGSKRQIRLITGVSDGLIAMMRRVVQTHQSHDAIGRAFRERLSRKIEDATWSLARAAYLDLPNKDFDEREAAANLARVLRDRFHGRLSENKRVTALALAIYDPNLPQPLAEQLESIRSDLTDDDQGVVTRGSQLTSELIEHVRSEAADEDEGKTPRDHHSNANLIDDYIRLRGDQERIARQIEAVEQKLQDQGFKPDQVTRSDAAWERAIER